MDTIQTIYRIDSWDKDINDWYQGTQIYRDLEQVTRKKEIYASILTTTPLRIVKITEEVIA